MRTNLWNVALALGGLVTLARMSAEAAAYRRPLHAAKVAAPIPNQEAASSYQDQNGRYSHRGSTTPAGYPAETEVNFAWNRMEGPVYGYRYTLNMRADGNWSLIELRCYGSRAGQVCVDAH